jgi:hypothetical protein
MLVFTLGEVIQLVCEEELVFGFARRARGDTEKPREFLFTLAAATLRDV